MRVGFVCTGNTCRSPMAAALARKILGVHMEVDVISRGIAVYFPSSANTNAVKAMESYEIDLSWHQAVQITEQDLYDIDLVLTMTEQHKLYVQRLYPEAAPKVHTLKGYIGQLEGDIPDPFGGNLDIYEECAKVLNECILSVSQKLMTNKE